MCVCVCVFSLFKKQWCVSQMSTHLRLHHVCAMKSQIKHNTVDVHHVSSVQLLKDPVKSDKGSGAAHSSTVRDKKCTVINTPPSDLDLVKLLCSKYTRSRAECSALLTLNYVCQLRPRYTSN